MTTRPVYSFRVLVTTDNRSGDVLAVNLRIRKGRSVETKEFGDGAAFADYDKKGELLNIEVLGPCEVKILDSIAASDVTTRKFIRDSLPSKMLLGKGKGKGLLV